MNYSHPACCILHCECCILHDKLCILCILCLLCFNCAHCAALFILHTVHIGYCVSCVYCALTVHTVHTAYHGCFTPCIIQLCLCNPLTLPQLWTKLAQPAAQCGQFHNFCLFLHFGNCNCNCIPPPSHFLLQLL